MTPPREYFYDVDLRGQLFHDGTQLTEPRFLDFFFKRLRKNDTGRFPEHPFLSPCAGELNFVRADDRPIVFHDLHTRRSGEELVYAASLAVPFAPDQLRVSPAGRLYHPAPVGGLGLMHSRLALLLGEDVREQDGGYVLHRGGRDYRMQPL